eukprot:XP_001705884.1 Hypothetical protein GL50803_37812 [Giardia lamblia ATCC 50803]
MDILHQHLVVCAQRPEKVVVGRGCSRKRLDGSRPAKRVELPTKIIYFAKLLIVLLLCVAQGVAKSSRVILLPLEVGLKDAHQLCGVSDVLRLMGARHGSDDSGELLDLVVLCADLLLQGLESGCVGLAGLLADVVRGEILQGALEARHLFLFLCQGLLEGGVNDLRDLGGRAVSPHAADLMVLVGKLLLEEADRVPVLLGVVYGLLNRGMVEERAEALELGVFIGEQIGEIGRSNYNLASRNSIDNRSMKP